MLTIPDKPIGFDSRPCMRPDGKRFPREAGRAPGCFFPLVAGA